MRLKMRFAFSVLPLLALLIFVPIVFQNCSAPLDEEAEVSSIAEGLPFAFDTTIDHVAYMSCSVVTQGSASPFFSFKAGAYDAGSGIRLRDNFSYEVRNLTQSQRIDALGQSPDNKDAYLQLGLRINQNFQDLRAVSNASSAQFVGSLTRSSVATPLVQLFSQNRLNTFSGAPLADSIKLFSSEAVAIDYRSLLSSNSALLTLGYSRLNRSPNLALGPSPDSATNIYGRGLTMGFRLGHGINSVGGITAFTSVGDAIRVMQNVRQYNLETGQDEGAWSCPSDWTFIIVRQADAIGTRCPNTANEPNPTLAQEAMYTALRKVLPAADWGVNLTQRCIVPKRTLQETGDCYGGAANVNYTGPSCDPAINNCPHYVTICKRP